MAPPVFHSACRPLKVRTSPFIFGGDGASLCIPPRDTELISQELAKLIRLAETNFSLQLRVACIPVRDIYRNGKDLLVAKLEITPGRFISLFRGGGLEYADSLSKSENNAFAVEAHSSSVKELSGLSCRWSPVPADKGPIVSMLLVARGNNESLTYQKLITQIRSILNCSIEDANPVSLKYGRYKSFRQALQDERRYDDSLWRGAFIKRLIDITIAVLIFKHRLNPLGRLFNDKRYTASIKDHSDYHKFDDTLRLIIDCRKAEYLQIQELLEASYRAGEIYYGLHEANEALMTCFVETTRQGGHLHFIDGGGCGLTMAAKQLKSQLQHAN